MGKTKIIGDTKADVGKTPLDFYSWGHVAMGIVTFLLLSLINNIPSMVEGRIIPIIPWWPMILLVLLVAVVWELLENTLLIDMGVKFEGRRDSIENALWDIIFVVIGGAIMWIFKGIAVNIYGVENIPLFYIVGIVSFVVVIICFLIGKFITK